MNPTLSTAALAGIFSIGLQGTSFSQVVFDADFNASEAIVDELTANASIANLQAGTSVGTWELSGTGGGDPGAIIANVDGDDNAFVFDQVLSGDVQNRARGVFSEPVDFTTDGLSFTFDLYASRQGGSSREVRISLDDPDGVKAYVLIFRLDAAKLFSSIGVANGQTVVAQNTTGDNSGFLNPIVDGYLTWELGTPIMVRVDIEGAITSAARLGGSISVDWNGDGSFEGVDDAEAFEFGPRQEGVNGIASFEVFYGGNLARGAWFDNFLVEAVENPLVSDPNVNVLSRSEIDFGTVPSTPGTAQEVLSIENNGPSQNLDISSITFSGPAAANFSSTTFPVSLMPGESGQIVVDFDAMGATGDLEATLEINSNDPDAADMPKTVSVTAFVDPSGDTDMDGLSDAAEFEEGTDPFDPDSDGDGLSDGAEVNDAGTEPLLADTDNDGFTDGEEVITFGSNPLADDDSDSDNLTDSAEFVAGTNPGNDDTDGDTLLDGDELAAVPPTNPLLRDTDGDGIDDDDELTSTPPTNPTLSDTDSDGFSDLNEIENGTGPTDPNDPVEGGLNIVFNTSFDYSAGFPQIGTIASNLNGADGQIGSWAGILPPSIGGQGGTDTASIQVIATGDTFLLVDLPADDASLLAQFARPISLAGGRVTMDLAVRRTTAGPTRDSEIVGLDTSGNEAFRLILNSSGSGEFNGRLGVVTPTDGILFELPVFDGSDGNGDFPFFDGINISGTVPNRVELTLDDSGYTIRVSQEGFLFYETEEIAYNGTPSDLASIQFVVQGSPDSFVDRGGLWVDDVNAAGIAFDLPDAISVLSVNFSEETRQVSIEFESVAGASYQVEASSDLEDFEVIMESLPSGGSVTEFTETVADGIPVRFYRFSLLAE